MGASPRRPSGLPSVWQFAQRRDQGCAKAVTGDVLSKLIGTCRTDNLRDVRGRAVLIVAFASGGRRRRSEIAGLRTKQLQLEEPTYVDGPLPCPLFPFISAAPRPVAPKEPCRNGRARSCGVFGGWPALRLSDRSRQSRHSSPRGNGAVAASIPSAGSQYYNHAQRRSGRAARLIE